MSEHQTSRPTARTVTELERPLSVVLGNDRRKRALSALLSADGAQSFDDLTVAVATSEEYDAAESAGRTRDVATTLHHIHLPKLADEDLLDYDVDNDRVTLTSAGARCAETLETTSPSRPECES